MITGRQYGKRLSQMKPEWENIDEFYRQALNKNTDEVTIWKSQDSRYRLFLTHSVVEGRLEDFRLSGLPKPKFHEWNSSNQNSYTV